MAGGWTKVLPTEDRHLWTRTQFVDTLAFSLAGRTAEEIIFGEVSTGAQNDLERATQLARKMVTEYGMSDKLGPRTFGKREELVFLGREIHEQRNYSEKIALMIDDEVNMLIRNAHDTARKIMENERKRLKLIAEKLIAIETIDVEEFELLMNQELPSSELEATPAS
jgi:cell division protease FtsH